MPPLIEDSLRVLDAWYNEPGLGNDRTTLLSKLAMLELCGWIEENFDELILEVDKITIKDSKWVSSHVTKKTSGFTYVSHFRPMLVTLIGELLTRRVEKEMDQKHNGELERMKSLLVALWKKRCNLAHADVAANVAAQVQFDAPSWTLNQYQMLTSFFDSLKKSIETTLASI